MSSGIQALAQKYKSKTQDQETEGSTWEQLTPQGERLERLGEAFAQMSVLKFCSQEKLQKISQTAIKQSAKSLLQSASKNRSISLTNFKRMIGQFINDQLNHSQSFQKLMTELEMNYEEEEEEEYQIQDNIGGFLRDNDERDYRSILREMQSKSHEVEYKLSESSLHRPQQTCLQGSYQQKVMTHLMGSSIPQTQLSYLCQEMRWKCSYNSTKFNSNQFQVVASVDFVYKKLSQTLNESYTAKTKKIGRLVASFKMLKRIYLSFPDIWDMYEEKRNKKSLAMNSGPHNPIKEIQSDILKEKIEHIAKKAKDEQSEKELQKQRETYLINISNFKSELNILNQHNPMVLTQKWDKNRIDGPGSHWIVRGELTVKYQGEQRTFDAVEQHLNSKVAEENITKSLVTRVYENYREILQKMVMIKNKKSIKT